jgi:hypothetical protein
VVVTSAQTAPSDWLATAELESTLVVVDAPRRLVEVKVEEAGCSLARQAEALTHPDRYPLILEFWNVSGGRMRPFGIDDRAWTGLMSIGWGGATAVKRALTAGTEWAVKTFGSYHEVLCGIPEVRTDGLDEPGILVTSMYTDSPFARIVDKALGYGLAKRPARFGVSLNEIMVVSEAGRLVAAFRLREPVEAPDSDSLPSAEVERWLHRRLIGRTPEGALVSSPMARKAVGDVRRARVELRIGGAIDTIFGPASAARDETLSNALAFRQRWVVALGAPSQIAVGARPSERVEA